MNADKPGICGKQSMTQSEKGAANTYETDIETEMLPTDGLEDIIKQRLLQETEVENLNMREGRHKFQLNPHIATKFHVLK